MVDDSPEEFLELSEDTSDLPMPEAASVLELDELNLLDLPPLEKGVEETIEDEISEIQEPVIGEEAAAYFADEEEKRKKRTSGLLFIIFWFFILIIFTFNFP